MRLLGTVASQPRNPAAWAPTLLAIPVISGSVTVGNTLTAGNGDWTGWPTSYSYQWQSKVSGVWTDVSGATSSTYTTDHAADYRVLVGASNAYGTAVAAASSAVTVSSATLATFNPSFKGDGITLSSGNTVATKSASDESIVLLQGLKSSGKFWVEIEMTAGANVPYTMLGLATAAVNANATPDVDSHSLGIYGGDTSGGYTLAYNASYAPYVSGKPFNGTNSVMCGLYDNDNRKFFMYVRNGASGAWLTDDPNVTPEGGVPYWPTTGDVAPLYSSYYSGVAAKLRTPAEFTESGVCPAGVTMGWYT